MRVSPKRAIAFALYQLSLLAGLALFPVAVAARRVGVTLPMHRLISRFGRAYENADTSSA